MHSMIPGIDEVDIVYRCACRSRCKTLKITHTDYHVNMFCSHAEIFI